MTNRTDTFTRADSTTALGTPSDGGSAWVADSGTWGIIVNQGYKQASAATFQVASLESSVSAVDVQVTVAAVGVNKIGVLTARVASDTDHILADSDGSGGNFIIYKKVANAYTSLATTPGSAVLSDVMRLRTDASDLLSLFKNGSLLISATDGAGNTNTRHGLCAYDATTAASMQFTAFSITAIVVPDGSLMGQSRQQFAMGLGA